MKKTTYPKEAQKHIELHIHTRYSTMDSTLEPEELVQCAARRGMPAVAVTDHGGVQAFPELWKAGKKYGVKIIYGIEGYCVDDTDGDAGDKPISHICLLVKNRQGLKNLYRIVSASHIQYYHRQKHCPIMPKSLIQTHREGLLVGSACAKGELYQAVLQKHPGEEQERIGSFYDYLEIMPLCNNRFLIEDGTVRDKEELREINRRIIDLGTKLGKPVAATCDVHFLKPEDEICRKILLASEKSPDADRNMPLYFRTTEDVMAEFSYLGDELCQEVVIENPWKIANQIEEFELLPKGLCLPKLENSKEELRRLVMEKMHCIYGEDPDSIVTERVNTELQIILNHGHDVIYMIAQKLVADSNAHGYLVGSRGGVGSSLAAYLAGITGVNPLPPHYVCPHCKHTEFVTDGSYGCGADMPDKNCPHCGREYRKDGFDIPFETFLGIPGDEKVPDIDLNFSGEYQANAHAYTKTLFGEDHVFKAGAVGTIAERTAYGQVKKYAEERGLVFNQAEMNRLAQGIVGVKRTTGQFSGGLIVIPQDMDITDFCPVQWAAENPDSGIMTTHLKYHFMEDYLLKLDELGHDNPTMINMLERLTGTDATKIRLDDPETMSLFKSPKALGVPDNDPIIGQTGSIGIPEFGTSFTRQMLVDTQPDKFDMLVRLSGYSHGTGVWLGNAQDLIKNGTASVSETIGCRDDIMLYLTRKGMGRELAYQIMENVRKGRLLTEEQEDVMEEHKVPQWYIDSCHKIEYLFPKAHAVAYVLMAFRIAWYKVHYPLAFYAALFHRRNQKDGFDAQMMLGGANKVKAKLNQIRSNPNATAKEEDLSTTLEMVYEFYMRGFDFEPTEVTHRSIKRFEIADGTHLRLVM